MTISNNKWDELVRATQYSFRTTILQDDEGVVSITDRDLHQLLHDSARMERIERQVRELADEWECEADNPSTTIVGEPDDIYRNLATALRAIVDTGGDK